MPPKKKFANEGAGGADGAETSGKFTWEGPNDTKILILTQGRYVKPEEYETLSKAMGTSTGSIRNRISSLRVKQRNLYEALGWDLPEGAATLRKRAGGEGEGETPVKRKRAVKKGKKEEEVEDDGGEGVGVGVKEEGDEV